MNAARQARQSGQCEAAKSLFNELANPGNQTFYQKLAGDEARTLNCSGGTTAPVGGGDASACANAQNNIRNAQGSLNNNLFDNAKKYAIAAQACPATSAEAAALIESIDRRSRSQKLVQSANIALRTNNRDAACKDILQIPDPTYPGVKELRAKAGGCEVAVVPPAVVDVNPPRGQKPPAPPPPPAAVDQLLDQYNKAVAMENRRPADAEKIYQNILQFDPEYKDVAERLKQIQEGQRINDFRELERRARNQLDKGDLQAARGLIERALTLRPTEPSLRDFKRSVEERLANESAALSSGVNAYYQGKYAEARKLLAAFVGDQHSARVLALGNFYLGAVSASEYFLSGAKDESKKQEATQLFSTLKDDRVFSPDWSIVKVSSKVRSLFVEATGKSGQR